MRGKGSRGDWFKGVLVFFLSFLFLKIILGRLGNDDSNRRRMGGGWN